jgi:hypothetical protein
MAGWNGVNLPGKKAKLRFALRAANENRAVAVQAGKGPAFEMKLLVTTNAGKDTEHEEKLHNLNCVEEKRGKLRV